MSIGVCYPDKYAVEETFQLLKVPWEWYAPGRQYDIVISRKADVPEWTGSLVDLTGNDVFSKVAGLLNTGAEHLHEPTCDILLDALRQELKKHTLLVEIPPTPWGHPYMVALTHDVDLTSVRECRWTTVGYAAYQCFTQGSWSAGLHLLLARCGFCSDPWVLFSRWKEFEDSLGVHSTFFFVPKPGKPGIRAHPYRAISYNVTQKSEVLRDLENGGWETGVHGLDNWADAGSGEQERVFLEPVTAHPGNRTHWLLFDTNSWKFLDAAGYVYDTTFGYNDDAGFRAGTLQAYRPRDVKNLLELPLHIQDLGLFGKFCWAPTENGWEKTPCLHLDEPTARAWCDRIFAYARTYGGAVTVLWHYENLMPPKGWSGFYADMVRQAKVDGAWVTTAGEVAKWFRKRREIYFTALQFQNEIIITADGILPEQDTHALQARVHIPPDQIVSIDAEYSPACGYIDIKMDKRCITVRIA
ncbi:hypothetical protein Mboo_1737 [Methanoregula boonei 6A8]|jgi:hypothetical protein|uniref:Uncharacterized protein n=1 Tax=Methanoregula boonei (strain DSM 21154 / JCM 14090 / 6A8) TaxID=456442 RepID=A7I943_METB6|nr:polysaccharide deacetylase family protein [Methanoregula boonei]ABS56254.1 hypothetical protein Mboo_1737 [Methanoregula boonei 6A8]